MRIVRARVRVCMCMCVYHTRVSQRRHTTVTEKALCGRTLERLSPSLSESYTSYLALSFSLPSFPFPVVFVQGGQPMIMSRGTARSHRSTCASRCGHDRPRSSSRVRRTTRRRVAVVADATRENAKGKRLPAVGGTMAKKLHSVTGGHEITGAGGQRQAAHCGTKRATAY